MAKTRISLKHLQLLATLVSASQPPLKPKSSDYNSPPRPVLEEIDGTKIIPELVKKFTKLAQTAKDLLKGSERDEGYKMFETLMHHSTMSVDLFKAISKESLIETVFVDPHLLSRDDIKKQSEEIVQAHQVADEDI